jgi:4-hydroxybenzoate polyprenyltransferase
MTEPASPAVDAPGVSAAARAPLMSRLWVYQAERFPVVKHGMLIAAFGASAVCLSALLRGPGETPSLHAIVVSILVLFCFFVQLRVADEHKDNEEDRKFRPERPVPRGLVTLKELRGVAMAAGALQLVLSATLGWGLVGLLLLVWGWMAVMTKEFFAPRALKKRPILYMVSHMAVMPLIDLYATACDWAPAGEKASGFGLVLSAFLALSLFNGIVLEIARKSWAPEQEREGVETYSRLWGPGRAGLAVAAAAFVGLVLSAYVHVQSGAGLVFLIGLLLAAAWLMYAAIEYASGPAPKTAKHLEVASGGFVLANYLLLGVLPMIERAWLS